MLLDSIYIVFLQTLAAPIYAGGDSYDRCRACMCGRDRYPFVPMAMGYLDIHAGVLLFISSHGSYRSLFVVSMCYADYLRYWHI